MPMGNGGDGKERQLDPKVFLRQKEIEKDKKRQARRRQKKTRGDSKKGGK